MESNKNVTHETGRTGSSTTTGGSSSATSGRGTTGTTGTTGSTGTTGTTGTTATSATTGSAPQRAREQGSEIMDQTKQAVSSAYDRTSEVLTNSYDQAMTYGREHPGQLTLIAFGAGIAIGLLLASGGRRSRTERIAEPVIDALSRVAYEFLR